MKASGANLWTVEAQLGDREFCVTEAGDPRDIQFRHWTEIWLKENMINAAIARLPLNWEKVAWIDADILFQRSDWVSECIHLLEVYQVIQMFSHYVHLGPNYEPMSQGTGFAYEYINGGLKPHPKPGHEYYPGYGFPFAHTGFAWAARREAIEALGGLIDWAILGSADHNMARALVGQVQTTFPGAMTSRYAKKMMMWQERAEKYVLRDIGYMPGLISHAYHGRIVDRRYVDRWKILVDNGFDPDLDLKRDSQGLFQLTDRNIKLRDELRAYFRARNEDTIET